MQIKDRSMTNPTNWPNPERPGAPPSPFDQRPYLDHVLRRKSDNRLVDVRFFPRGGPGTGDWCFGNMNRMNEREAAERFHYHTPCLTPTRIAELLAGERERCAKECDEKVAFANHELKASASHEETRYWIGEHCAATFCADAIRGLGDKA